MTTPLLLFVIAALALQTVPAAAQFNNGSIKLNLVININGSIPITYEAQTIESSNIRCQENTYTCGGTGGWTRIAYLNMNDSSHQCPGDLREFTFEGIRLCGRDSRADKTVRICTSATFPTNGTPYTTSCGRVVAYNYGGTTGFGLSSGGIDGYYVAGVTLTHGPVGAREHIWTFVSGWDENSTTFPEYACPCAPGGSTSPPPSFVGNNYFCESGVHTWPGYGVFHNDPLWDGDGCSKGNSCCTFNNPPYFTRQLPASTSDNIELRDCNYDVGIGGKHSSSDVLIQFIELYVK